MGFEHFLEGKNTVQEQRRESRTGATVDQSLADQRQDALELKSAIHLVFPGNEIKWTRLQVMQSVYESSDLWKADWHMNRDTSMFHSPTPVPGCS